MKVLTFLLLMAAPLAVPAQFTFITNNGTLTIKGYTGPGGAVAIPATTNGLPVVSIGINAFLNNTTLTNVTIPGGVTNIGDSAFYNCIGLANITIANTLTNIGNQAFYGCTNLASVILPNNVSSIGQSAFFNCAKLGRVTVPNSVTNLGDYAFSGCKGLTNLTISNGLTNIGNSVFGSCTGLTGVTIPNSVTNIGNGAFGGCIGLTNIMIGTNVASIGTNAFYGCKGLLYVILPNRVSLLADYAFGDCESLTNIILGNGVTNIGVGAFYFCTSLPNVAIPRFATNIGVGVFDSCDSLTAITVDQFNSTYSSAAGALFNKNQTTLIECPGGLRSYTIPNGVTNIQDLAFSHCYSLRSVTIPSTVIGIGSSAFSASPNLASVYCKGNAPSIGSAAFYADTDATAYYLSGKTGWGATFGGIPAVKLDPSLGSLQVTLSPTTAITAGAWWQLDGGVAQSSGTILTSLSVGTHTLTFNPLNGWAMPVSQTVAVVANSLTNATVVYGQLIYQTNNGTITITGTGPAGPGSAVILPGTINFRPVTSIGDYAFYDEASLTSIAIPSTVTNIGNAAFILCSKLGAITVDPANSFFSSTNGVLFNKDQTTLLQFPGGVGGSYAIPPSVTSIGDYSFELCTYLTSVTIPNSVTNISLGAFYECTGLVSMTIPSSVTIMGDYIFGNCSGLARVYFSGNAPAIGSNMFYNDDNVTVYYLPGTTGWDPTFGDVPAVLWNPQATTFIADGNQFGFNITGPTNTTIVVVACTDLANPVWQPVSTNTLDSSGTSVFSDPQWANYPRRFYKFRSP